MGEYKAHKICTIGNDYYWESEFSYRGYNYTVHYSSGYTTFSQKPAYLQHKEEQKRIDEIIENKNNKKDIKSNDAKSKLSFDEEMEIVWKMLEW